MLGKLTFPAAYMQTGWAPANPRTQRIFNDGPHTRTNAGSSRTSNITRRKSSLTRKCELVMYSSLVIEIAEIPEWICAVYTRHINYIWVYDFTSQCWLFHTIKSGSRETFDRCFVECILQFAYTHPPTCRSRSRQRSYFACIACNWSSCELRTKLGAECTSWIHESMLYHISHILLKAIYVGQSTFLLFSFHCSTHNNTTSHRVLYQQCIPNQFVRGNDLKTILLVSSPYIWRWSFCMASQVALPYRYATRNIYVTSAVFMSAYSPI